MASGALRTLALLGFAGSAEALRLEESARPELSARSMPDYFDGMLPPNYKNMTFMEKADIAVRLERWHAAKHTGRCDHPLKGEKVVYFLQHGDAAAGRSVNDAPVLQRGAAQAKNVRLDPMMSKALSHIVPDRVQVVITSPAQKALQTAVMALAEVLPDARWEVDSDVRGVPSEDGLLQPRLAAAALTELSNEKPYAKAAASLLSQYNRLPAGWEKATTPAHSRWLQFVDRLLARRERRFVVVTHGGFIAKANVGTIHPGEVVVRALTANKTWRALSTPDCWPVAQWWPRPNATRK